ncbi:MAG: hypothetical protein WEB00_07760 [Dehalococcoidia bacterium]
MAVFLDVRDQKLFVHFSGWDSFFTLRRRLDVPLQLIREVREEASPPRPITWLCFRGSALPGLVAAGVFWWRGGFSFWSWRRGRTPVVFELVGARYKRLIIGFPEPDSAVALLRAALADRP